MNVTNPLSGKMLKERATINIITGWAAKLPTGYEQAAKRIMNIR